MGSETDDSCDAWQADHLEIIVPKSDDDHHPKFFIRFKVEFNYPSAIPLLDDDENDFLLVQFDLASTVSSHDFWANCSQTPGQEEILPWAEISTMLTRIRIPLQKQPFMLHRISNLAQEMANASKDNGLKVLPMMVSIRMAADYFCGSLQDSTTLIIKENPNVAKMAMAAPASEVAIQGLTKEIVVVHDREEHEERARVHKCGICLEEIEVGSEMIAMPCSHYYHPVCLLRWLKICSFCPICRLNLAA